MPWRSCFSQAQHGPSRTSTAPPHQPRQHTTVRQLHARRAAPTTASLARTSTFQVSLVFVSFNRTHTYACRLRGIYNSVCDDPALHCVCQLCQPRVPVSHQLRQWLGRQPHHLFLHFVDAWRCSVLLQLLVWQRWCDNMSWSDHYCFWCLTQRGNILRHIVVKYSDNIPFVLAALVGSEFW